MRSPQLTHSHTQIEHSITRAITARAKCTFRFGDWFNLPSHTHTQTHITSTAVQRHCTSNIEPRMNRTERHTHRLDVGTKKLFSITSRALSRRLTSERTCAPAIHPSFLVTDVNGTKSVCVCMPLARAHSDATHNTPIGCSVVHIEPHTHSPVDASHLLLLPIRFDARFPPFPNGVCTYTFTYTVLLVVCECSMLDDAARHLIANRAQIRIGIISTL